MSGYFYCDKNCCGCRGPAGTDTLTVVNNSGSPINYENSSLTVVKLQ